MSHLTPDDLLDIAEGTRPESSAPHLAACASCRGKLANVREMMAAVVVDVPEPSPLFWDHLSARVREATAAEAAGRSPWWHVGPVSWRLAAVMSLAVAVVAVSLTMRMSSRSEGTKASPAAAVPVEDIGVLPLNDDPSLNLLGDLAGGLDWDAAAEAGLTMQVGAADHAVAELNAGERAELQRLLREAISGSGA
jgi:hypothetical protein